MSYSRQPKTRVSGPTVVSIFGITHKGAYTSDAGNRKEGSVKFRHGERFRLVGGVNYSTICPDPLEHLELASL